MIGVIKGTGSSIPYKIIDNHDLSEMVETDDTWIRERTGVEKRHVIEEETTVSMGIEAAKRALENGNLLPQEVDMIIVATASSDVVMPNTACMIQARIGAERAVCFDLNAACSGFLFAYNTAQVYIAMGMAQNILVIGTESLSKLVDWTDRGTCILFGDGAGAVLLTAEEGKVSPMIMHANGTKGDALTCCTIFPSDVQTHKELVDQGFIHMNGQEVFKFAIKQVPMVIEELLEEMQMDIQEIDYFILHQANKRIVESVAKRLKRSIDQFPMNLQEYGNTSSASIPILLDELNRTGRLKPGMKLVMAGFGAGLTWGASYLSWHK